MSVATTIDLYVSQGEDYMSQIYWLDSSNKPWPMCTSYVLNGNTVLTPAYMEIKDNAGTSRLKLSSNAPSGWLNQLSVNGTVGLVQINITSNQTSALTPDVYSYDLFVYYTYTDEDDQIAGAKRTKLARGRVLVDTKVTSLP